jgi:hypothetical protein
MANNTIYPDLTTGDIYLTALLVFYKFEPTLFFKDGRIYWTFQGSPQVYEASNRFTENVLIPVHSYVHILKKLKSHLIEAKGGR